MRTVRVTALVSRITSLVRWLDLRLPSNRFVVLAALVAFGAVLGYELYAGAEMAAGLLEAALAAGAIFLAWALGRELDPDEPASAGAATIGAVLLLAGGEPNLAASLSVLVALRIVVRTTGRTPTALDLLFVTGLAAFTARTADGFPASLALPAALLVDHLLAKPRGALWAGLAAAVAALAAAFYFGTIIPAPIAPSPLEWGLLGLAALAILTLRVPAPRSRDDRRAPLSRQRLKLATVLAGAVGVATALFAGGHAVWALLPVWAALAAVALTRTARVGATRPGSPTV